MIAEFSLSLSFLQPHLFNLSIELFISPCVVGYRDLTRFQMNNEQKLFAIELTLYEEEWSGISLSLSLFPLSLYGVKVCRGVGTEGMKSIPLFGQFSCLVKILSRVLPASWKIERTNKNVEGWMRTCTRVYIFITANHASPWSKEHILTYKLSTEL